MRNYNKSIDDNLYTYLLICYLYSIYLRCHILFQFATRLAFDKGQNLSQNPEAVNNIGIVGVKIYEKQQILLFPNC